MSRRVPLLQSDCSRCAALCCVALWFERSDDFAIDKPSGVPCPNLGSDHRCRIHEGLRTQGFRGCAEYDCFGAGQRVTEEFSLARRWHEDEKRAARTFDAFWQTRDVQGLLVALEYARSSNLSAAQEAERRELMATLSESGRWSSLEEAAALRGIAVRVRRLFGRSVGAASSPPPIHRRAPA